MNKTLLSKKICSVEGCERLCHSSGYCNAHNLRVWRNGVLGSSLISRCFRGLIAGRPRQEHKLYCTWRKMKERCNNPNHKFYKYYGGRNIKVCKRWDDFANFLKDMGERPQGMTLDRIDGSKGYSPGNCRWATKKEQA